MKRILAAFVLVGVSGFAFAQSTAIEGNWGIQQQAGDITFDITFSISKTSTTVTNVCTGFGKTLTAQVTVQSTYTDTALTATEAKQDSKSVAGLDCNISAEAGTLNYVVQGNQLVLTMPGNPDSFVLTRK